MQGGGEFLLEIAWERGVKSSAFAPPKCRVCGGGKNCCSYCDTAGVLLDSTLPNRLLKVLSGCFGVI